MPEGKLVNDKYVMFGEPVNEKVLSALKNNSPTANEIIGSLPASVFEETEIRKQIQKEKELIENLAKEKEVEEAKQESTLSKKQLRLMRKQGIKVEEVTETKEVVEEVEEETIQASKAPSAPVAGNILKNFLRG